jgi:hypothetical protein
VCGFGLVIWGKVLSNQQQQQQQSCYGEAEEMTYVGAERNNYGR